LLPAAAMGVEKMHVYANLWWLQGVVAFVVSCNVVDKDVAVRSVGTVVT